MAVRTIYLNSNGYTTPVSVVYRDTSRPDMVFADYACTTPIPTVPIPWRACYTFAGYYFNSYTQVIDANGNFLPAFHSYGNNNVSYYANGAAVGVPVSLWNTDGTGSAQIYRKNGDAVNCYGDDMCTGVIHSVATPVRNGYRFTGFYDAQEGGNRYVDESGTILSPPGVTLYAQWQETAPQKIFDYFGFASSALIPIASESGDQKHRVAASNGGRYSTDVSQAGCIWRNPSVTYLVVQDVTVSLKLGKAFTAVRTDNVITRSGYMITAAILSTETRRFPTLTVSAVANEGADAINLFDVQIPVVARAHAQNLCGAFDASSRIIKSTVSALCDPIVVERQLIPCASDAVNGRIEASAEVLVLDGESEPSVVGTGFSLSGVRPMRHDGGFMHYTIGAIKEIY